MRARYQGIMTFSRLFNARPIFRPAGGRKPRLRLAMETHSRDQPKRFIASITVPTRNFRRRINISLLRPAITTRDPIDCEHEKPWNVKASLRSNRVFRQNLWFEITELALAFVLAGAALVATVITLACLAC